LPARVLVVGAVGLLLQGLDVGREEAVQVEGVAFAGGEGGAFVVVGRADQVAALVVRLMSSLLRWR
jgi:hypothetical protein